MDKSGRDEEMAPKMIELTEVLGYTTCPACGSPDAAVWLGSDGSHTIDCSTVTDEGCGYGAIIKAATR